MLQYLTVLLSSHSTSFCVYDNRKDVSETLMPLDFLKSIIFYAMKENLMLQFVYPKQAIPSEYHTIIDSIDHVNIIPIDSEDNNLDITSSISVINNLAAFNCNDVPSDSVIAIRASRKELSDNYDKIEKITKSAKRVNVVLTDAYKLSGNESAKYKEFLSKCIEFISTEYGSEKRPQLNVLTDRIGFDEMANCGAGDSCLTFAPNGQFYICPAFYYDDPVENSIGNIENGIHIPNSKLYKLEYAPICKHCDAYHCKRCVWCNKMSTLEVNIPSHEQCVVSHLERNASRELLCQLQKMNNSSFDGVNIEEISYMDPIEVQASWDAEERQTELLKYHKALYND